MVEQIETDMLNDFTKVMDKFNAAKINEKPIFGSLLIYIFQFFKENATMCAALLSSNGDIAFVNNMKEIARKKCLEHLTVLFHNGNVNNFEYFSNFILSGCIGLFEIWLKNGLVETPEQMAELSQQIILYGSIKIVE
jgi:hypothetical protein